MKSGYLSEIFVSFQGEGSEVGRRHLFVRTAGCNLRCRYCDTPDSLERVESCAVHQPDGVEIVPNPIAAEEAFQIISNRLRADEPIDGIALTGGEPLLQADFLADVLSCGEVGVPVLLETNGVLPGPLERLIGAIDIVSMDIKPPSNTGEPEFWRQHREFLAIARRKQAYIKVLVDDRTTDDDIEAAAAVVAEVAPDTRVFLQPVMSATGVAEISAPRLARAYAHMRRRLSSVRVLPQTHKILKIQ